MSNSIHHTDELSILSRVEERLVLKDNADMDNYDLDAMETDAINNNLDIETDDLSDYLKENIVLTSLVNGQRKQAIEQCERYGFDFSDFTDKS